MLQYEEIVKFFGEQTYIYLSTNELLYDTIVSDIYSNIVINYKSINDFDSYINNEDKIYLYCKNDEIYKIINPLIIKNSISTLNILKAVSEFKIPYYGDQRILNNYLFYLPSRDCCLSLNVSRIKDYLDKSNNNLFDYLQKKSNEHYLRYKIFFNVYRNSRLNIFDIVYASKTYIFKNYIKLIEMDFNEETLELYMKGVGREFQYINFGTEESFINDNVDLNYSLCFNLNKIINNYIEYFFFKLMLNHDNIINVPLYMENNTIYSKNLCYFLLLKQIRILNNTINIGHIFTEEKLKDIYNGLKKGSSTIEDCILDKYYSHKQLNKIGRFFNYDFYKLFELEFNIRQIYFKLVNNDDNSYFYLMQHSHPSYSSLDSISPRYFPLNQINIYSFISASPIIQTYNYNKNVIERFNYLIILCLICTWAILFFVVIFIMNKIKFLVIEPIINLKDFLNSKEINDSSKLEYKYDDEINKFFNSCKLILSTNKERKSNNISNCGNFIKTKINNSKKDEDNLDIKNSNMILNLKMINELIDSEKIQELNGSIIEWNWKKIYNEQKLIKEKDSLDDNYLIKKNKRKRASISEKNNCIFLQKTLKSNDYESDEEVEENEIKFETEEEEESDLLYYKDLLLMTEYIYNNSFYNNKFNKYKNNKNSNIIKKIKNFLNMPNSKNKNFTYIWYSKIKEDNKTDFFKYYFNKSFEDIFVDEFNYNKSINNSNSIIK